ncbi:excalibur calcium-binding domain-containing protein [Variovorax sp. RB2P76]|uniref:excalibur calcium-binding domain-containing protein n=1 Tax=Variovorax sp. RB2P76 TaxID=3443736 RepID=UPI003F48EE2F
MAQAHPISSEPFGFTSTQQPSAAFTCDGRKHCSQMTSCQEATYFLKNCPGVKMDGNNDGVPCEQQWCKP